MANLVYAKTGPEAELITDSVADHIRQKLDAKGENRQLLDKGEYIADYRGTEYWIKKSGKWKQEKIEEIGVALDHGEIPVSEITPEIQAEISAQQEAERITAMPPEEKAKAKQAALDALADEADRLDRRNKIQRAPFDPAAYYDEHAAAVEAKYA